MTAASEQPLLEVRDLVQRYTLPRESVFKPPGQVLALNGVSARVTAGKSLGVVGESGSGKSTFARCVMALERPTSGSVAMLGRDLHALSVDELRRARRDFQMVFQDPYGSLDPRQTIARVVAEPLTSVPIRRWISGAPIREVRFGIISAGVPHCRAAALPGIAAPSFISGLTGLRDRVEAPDFGAGFRIERRDDSGRAPIPAGA